MLKNLAPNLNLKYIFILFLIIIIIGLFCKTYCNIFNINKIIPKKKTMSGNGLKLVQYN